MRGRSSSDWEKCFHRTGIPSANVLRKAGLFANDRHPHAERIARHGLYLPSGLALTEDQIARSAQALKEILA